MLDKGSEGEIRPNFFPYMRPYLAVIVIVFLRVGADLWSPTCNRD
jgi:hypothetical protein